MTRRTAGAGRATMAGRGALSAGAIPALAYVGAPWWAVTLVALALVVGAASVGLAERVFPQDSRDRRDWWLDLWQHRARRGTSR